jgi:hypothetical protein
MLIHCRAQQALRGPKTKGFSESNTASRCHRPSSGPIG